jgi:1,4-dihydroxy-2-naphthoate polyprenyltransferase
VLASLPAFVRLSRFKFLAGGIAGGALGTSIAGYETGGVDWRSYGLAQLAISAFHLMTHYANDYFDCAGDAGAKRTPFSGGSGALVDGSLAPVVALRASLACATVGALAALGLWFAANAELAAALAAAIAVLAWIYSAPPLRLTARGLGELDTALVVAVLVPLCAFAAQRHAVDLRALAAALPGAAAMVAMMLAVEFPDLAADTACGKRNVLVRLGVSTGARLGAAAVAAIYGCAPLALAAGAPLLFGIAIAATLPAGFALVRAFRRRRLGESVDEAELAGRGVALFFITTSFGALAFAAAVRLPGSGAG